MLKAGDKIDRYVVEALLGQGGMGEVYSATDTKLGRRVALKLIRGEADAPARERMLREARTAAAFEHANVVVIYDVGEADGSPFLAMELVRGCSMRALVADPSVSIARRVRWLVDSARALAAAHRAGLVHRDVKPDNVMIRDDGAVKVLDFGIARRRAVPVDPSSPTSGEALATLTAKGVIVGTPLYAAPEQLRAEEVDGRADQFAWGVMAYELLAGAPPWDASDSMTLLAHILSAEPPPLASRAPDAPPEVAEAVHRALAKRPGDRFESMEAAADAIEPWAEAPRTRRDGVLTPRSMSEPPIALAETSAAISTGKGSETVPSAPPATLSRTRRVVRRTLRIAVGVLAGLGALIVVGIVIAVARGGNFTIGVNASKDGGAVDSGARPVVPAFGCSDAALEGAGATPELAHALGIGACARLATELGVAWSRAGGTPLEVRAKLGAEDAEVTLDAAGQRASATAKSLLVAAAKASAALASELAPPPMGEAEIKGWGAKDEASARRIDRVWRRLIIDATASPDAEVKELIAADPDSPWPHGFAMLLGLPGMESVEEEKKQALAHVELLTPARQGCLRAIVLLRGSSADHAEGIKLMRKAYADAPDDPLVHDLYAAILITAGLVDEGYAALERLYARDPTRSIISLNNALLYARNRDLERDRKLLEKLVATLPEARAWNANVRYLVVRGELDEARAALEFGRRLGMSGGGDADPGNLAASRAMVELAALDGKAVRSLAGPLLADPQVQSSTEGAMLTIASYWIEGRAVDAQSALNRELARQRANGSPLIAASLVADEARSRRWLGQAPISAERLATLDAALARTDLQPPSRSALLAESAIARAALAKKPQKSAGEEVLRTIEKMADEAAEGDRGTHDAVLVRALSLVRAARGDVEASKLWRDTARAHFGHRRRAALDAALALEATGDREGAEQAYLLACEPGDIADDALMAMLAHARLGELYLAEKRPLDAAREDALLAKAWSGADPGMREAARRLK